MPDVELEAARANFSHRLESLRDSMPQGSGRRAKRPGAWLLMVAGALGLALAVRSRRRKGSDEPG